MDLKLFIFCFIITALLKNTTGDLRCITKMGEDICDLIHICGDGQREDMLAETGHEVNLDYSDCFENENITLILNSNFEVLNYLNDYITLYEINNVIIKVTSETNASLPADLFLDFDICQHLDLSNNSIKKLSNNAFGNLIFLKNLNLSMNNINNLQKKIFAQSYNKPLSHLNKLDLSQNKIQHITDSVFLYTPSLTHLYLQSNEISSLTRDSFVNLTVLEVLNLNHNKIRNLNKSLSNLHKLINLDLSHNFLTSLSESDLSSLVQLQILNVSYNFIGFISPCSFPKAQHLKIVDLYQNKNLNINNILLQINYNLVSLDSDFKITKMNIPYHNKNTNELSKSSFSGLICISSITINSQNITTIKNYTFTDIVNLKSVNVSNNYISNIEAAAFFDASQIIILDLAYNKLSNVTFLANCLANLNELYINNNNIKSLAALAFENQTNLTKLDISMNMIANIEPNSLPLSNLQYLQIHGNNLAGVMDKNIFSPAKELRFLNLRHCGFIEIAKNALTDMSQVTSIDLSCNKLKQIHFGNFRGMNNIVSLNVSNNNLLNLKFDNVTVTNLEDLYAYKNTITKISDLLSNMSHTLPNIKRLYLSHNQIRSFQIADVNSSQSLLILDISYNPIPIINIAKFENLLIANLSNMVLNSISNHMFPEFLRELYLNANNITDLVPGTFMKLKYLRNLDMSYNGLRKLRYGSLKGLYSLEVLHLSNNLIEVLDVHVFHESSTLKELYLDYNKIKYVDIDNMVVHAPEMEILSIGGNPIKCEDVLHSIRRSDLLLDITSLDKIYHNDNVNGIGCNYNIYFNVTNELVSIDDNVSDMSTVISCVKYSMMVTGLIVTALVINLVRLDRVNNNKSDSINKV